MSLQGAKRARLQDAPLSARATLLNDQVDEILLSARHELAPGLGRLDPTRLKGWAIVTPGGETVAIWKYMVEFVELLREREAS